MHRVSVDGSRPSARARRCAWVGARDGVAIGALTTARGLSILLGAMKVGETLSGRYLLRGALAACQGEAFLADDLRTRKAVRVVTLEAGRVDPGGLRRYAELLARAGAIRHAGAGVPRVQVSLAGAPLFVVGELAPGEELAALLRRESRLPWERALALIHGVAEALAALASTGVAHRALRPECIWVASDGQVSVHEFGVAELGPIAAAQRGQEFVEYRAPEQVAGASGDERSDVFALGAILLEMITGQHPFAGASAFKAAHKVATQAAPPASSLVSGVPSEVEALIARALAREPGERPASAQVLASQAALVRRSPGIVSRRAAAGGAVAEAERTLSQPIAESEEDLTTAVSLPIVRAARERETSREVSPDASGEMVAEVHPASVELPEASTRAAGASGPRGSVAEPVLAAGVNEGKTAALPPLPRRETRTLDEDKTEALPQLPRREVRTQRLATEETTEALSQLQPRDVGSPSAVAGSEKTEILPTLRKDGAGRTEATEVLPLDPQERTVEVSRARLVERTVLDALPRTAPETTLDLETGPSQSASTAVLPRFDRAGVQESLGTSGVLARQEARGPARPEDRMVRAMLWISAICVVGIVVGVAVLLAR